MNVLMIGAGRDVKGGVSTVVNQYYDVGLDKYVNLKYIATMEDGNKIKKMLIAIKAYSFFGRTLKSYDIVHVHLSHRSSFYRKSLFIKKAYSAKKKIIIHLHGSEFDVFYHNECNEKQKKKVRRIFEMADSVIVLSEEWRTKVCDFCSESKITVIYNAVKMPDFIRTDYQDNNILFLGRLGKRKGSYDLLEAVPLVIREVPTARFYLGGDGDVRETLNKIKEFGISNSVNYIGWVAGEKKHEMLKKCSTYVLPSYHEGMPMSVLEAMSYGEAVVSTTIGGIPKIIQSGYNGILVQPGDIKGLANAIVSVLKENKQYFGVNGYQTIKEKFNAEKNINILLKLYNNIYEEKQ